MLRPQFSAADPIAGGTLVELVEVVQILHVTLLRAGSAISLTRLRTKHWALNAKPLSLTRSSAKAIVSNLMEAAAEAASASMSVGELHAHAAPALRASALAAPKPTAPER